MVATYIREFTVVYSTSATLHTECFDLYDPSSSSLCEDRTGTDKHLEKRLNKTAEALVIL